MSVPHVSVTDLEKMKGEKLPFILLDVREDFERDICVISYENEKHIPMKLIPSEHSKVLDKDAKIIVYCRSGQRSSNVTQYLIQEGYIDVSNLDGGILEWGKSVDPSCPSY